MKSRLLYLPVIVFSLLLIFSCNKNTNNNEEAKYNFEKLDHEELMKKYGPENMDSSEITSIIDSIEWTTNNDVSILGSPDAKKGGEVIGGSAHYPATLRIVGKNSSDYFLYTIQGFIFESLLGLDPITLEYTPGLADKWCISDDKSVYYFHINDIAKWSDGMPVTSFDVVATWDLLIDKDIEEPFTNDYYNKYERPVALTDKIVMIKPKSTEWRLFLSFSATEVLPEHIIGRITAEQYMKDFNNEIITGTGPYMFDKAARDNYIILKKDDNWWAKDLPVNQGAYNFDTIKFIFYSDEEIIDEKFKKGEIDILGVRVARKWANDFTKDKIESINLNHIIKQRVYNQFASGIQGYWFNMRKPPFDDIRVRKAVSKLYNRKKMMEKLFFNEYGYMDSFFVNSPYENKNNPKVRYNFDEAVQLLEEAGWSQENLNDEGYLVKNGEVFELEITNYDDDNRIFTVFQEDLANAGIKLDIKRVTWAEHIKQANELNFKIFHAAYTGNIFPNPEGAFHSKYADIKNSGNYSGFKNKRADEIIEQYNFEYDLKKRIELLTELDGILTNEYIMAFDWSMNNVRMLYWNKFDMPEFVFSRFDRAGTSSVITYWWYDDERSSALKKAVKNKNEIQGRPEEVNYWDKYSRNY